jgi:glycosyltransferase involved in cell wall biosynthesis
MESTPPQVELSVVIPAFNEEKGIGRTVDELRHRLEAESISFEIIIVDDGSTDGTRKAAEESGARVIAVSENRGYGAALKRGIKAGNSPFVAITDADGTYPASDLTRMLEIARDADMVVGARSASMKNVPLMRRPAKLFLNKLANFLSRRNIPDLNSGLRVFRRSSLEQFLPLLPEGFSFTTTITLCMVCSHLNVQYVAIDYRPRIGKSSMRPREFFNFILLVVRAIVLFNPLRVFLPLGAFLFLAGVAKLIYDIAIGNLSESAIFGLLAAIMIWSLGLVADMISRLHLRQ